MSSCGNILSLYAVINLLDVSGRAFGATVKPTPVAAEENTMINVIS